MASERILVTGGAGFVGSHVVEYLCGAGYHVRIVDNGSGPCGIGLLARTPKGVDIMLGDLSDADVAATACAGVDGVVHLAAIASTAGSWSYPRSTQQSGEVATLNVLRACAQCNVRRAVIASSAAVYGSRDGGDIREAAHVCPINPYGASKTACEAYANVFGRLSRAPDTVILRYFNVYGPLQPCCSSESAVVPQFIDGIKRHGRVWVTGDGYQTRDFVHVTDVARASILALERDAPFSGMAINVGTGVGTKINDLASLLAGILRIKATIKHAAATPGDIRHSWANIELARTELKYDPKIGLDDGLHDTIAKWVDA